MMAEQGTGANWSALADEVFSGMAEWRVQHPRATFAEIEQEVDARLAGLRGRMLQDLALRSRQTDLRGVPAAERPRCPQCGAVLEARGKQVRRLTTNHNQEVALARSYAVCPRCGSGLFPPG
jgi:ribosomal protein S27AE